VTRRTRDLDAEIRGLYAGPREAFVRERDAMAKARAAAGDAEGAARIRGLRKPTVPAWALDRLAHEDPEAVRDLVALGERLRTAQRRALSGGDAEALRAALEERRRKVAALTRRASEILEKAGIGAASHRGDLVATLEAAAADEESAAALLAGALATALRPPSAFDEQGLRVLEGGRRAEPRTATPAPEPSAGTDRARVKELGRALSTARRRERSTAEAVERARGRLAELEAKRAEAREALKAAEAEHRGASVEARRLAAALAKSER
jgi:hypothetical protein